MIGSVAVLYASRYGLPAVLRIALGGVCLFGAIGATGALQHLMMTPDTAARDAVARIAEAPQLRPLPVGSDPIAPISLSGMLTLRGQIGRGAFAAAESTLMQLKTDARGDVRRETPWRTMYEMGFHAQGPAFSAALDRWVANAAPDDAIPLTVRAWHRFWTGDAIATDAGVAMTQEVYREYVQANADAARDATDALRRDADDLPAFWMLQLLAREEDDRDASRAILARALRRSPTSFESYALTMRAMYPNVHGSLREMREIADQAAAEVPHNPQLAALARFAAWTQLDDRVEDPSAQDIQGLRDLVAVDPQPLFIHSLGHALWHGGHPQEAIVMIDSAIALDPLFVNAYVTRRKYYYAQGNDSAHTADSLTVVAIDPQLPY
jgi:tetratricopeptide (TPR) repeat protein